MKNEGRDLSFFLWVAALWAALGAAICWKFNPSGTHLGIQMGWLAGILLVCVADLYALAKLASALLELSGGDEAAPKNQGTLVIRASSWGAIKLACLALIGFVLFQGREIPTLALLTGLGTLIVVPIAGGLVWHQRGNRHA